MNLEKFTIRSQEIIKSAYDTAVAGKRQYVTALEILQAILTARDAVIDKLIVDAGGNIDALRKDTENEVNKVAQVSGNVQTVVSQDLMKLPWRRKISRQKQMISLLRLKGCCRHWQ